MESLPDDTIRLIFRMLSFEDRMKTGSLCRKFNKILLEMHNNNSIWSQPRAYDLPDIRFQITYMTSHGDGELYCNLRIDRIVSGDRKDSPSVRPIVTLHGHPCVVIHKMPPYFVHLKPKFLVIVAKVVADEIIDFHESFIEILMENFKKFFVSIKICCFRYMTANELLHAVDHSGLLIPSTPCSSTSPAFEMYEMKVDPRFDIDDFDNSPFDNVDHTIGLHNTGEDEIYENMAHSLFFSKFKTELGDPLRYYAGGEVSAIYTLPIFKKIRYISSSFTLEITPAAFFHLLDKCGEVLLSFSSPHYHGKPSDIPEAISTWQDTAPTFNRTAITFRIPVVGSSAQVFIELRERFNPSPPHNGNEEESHKMSGHLLFHRYSKSSMQVDKITKKKSVVKGGLQYTGLLVWGPTPNFENWMIYAGKVIGHIPSRNLFPNVPHFGDENHPACINAMRKAFMA